MKRFLSLVLSLVMVMSLVTISAGAKDFTDDDKITYEEAVAVISEIGVVSGDKDGSFRPTDSLTRQAAAKIICNMILGPTTAVELHADTAPYRDVPANYEFAGYIAYCQKQGIISGYGDGTFRPTAPLTGYAFMKMLLGALGYDAKVEQYEGANWSINVAKRALGIGLAAGQTSEFSGIRPVTREEAALYAFNTLQADLVKYGTRLTTTVNGAEVTLASGEAESRTWESQQTKIDNIREDNIVQFAEEYFRKLEKSRGEDDFMRPGYTWIYDKEEIGTYVDYSLMVAEYTSSVSGRDMYDVLTAGTLRDCELEYYVNGTEGGAGNPSGYTKDIDTTDIYRGNQDDLGESGNGVLTQVFVDKDREEITITSIHTWLGKASSDYNEDREFAPVEIFTGKGTSIDRNVDLEDVSNVVDVKEDDFFLVNLTYKYDNQGVVVELQEPDVIEKSAVTKYSAGKDGDGTDRVKKLTAAGTEYKNNVTAWYKKDVLNHYATDLLTDRTYNVYLDQYGYFIGVEEDDGAKNYVFITGFDRPTSNLSIKTADAAGIFLDGTMQQIKVNVKDTDKNIEKVNPVSGTPAVTSAGAEGENYYIPWDVISSRNPNTNAGGFYALNRWFTYRVNSAGVYTLTPAVKTTVTKFSGPGPEVLKTASLYVDDTVLRTGTDPYNGVGSFTNELNTGATQYAYNSTNARRAYGNDDSVYITVETDEVDTSSGVLAVTDVSGVYTGIQNVEIEIEAFASSDENYLEEGQVYTVYDDDNYIVGCVTNGQAKGTNATVAYVLSGPKSERIEDGVYYWEFEAVVDGEIKTLTVKDNYDRVINQHLIGLENDDFHEKMGKYVRNGYNPMDMPSPLGASLNLNKYDGLVELRFDANDEYVVNIRDLAEKDIQSFYGNSKTNPVTPGKDSLGATLNLADAKAYRANGVNAYMSGGADWNGGLNHYDSAPNALKLVGRTLYVTDDQTDDGIALASDAKAVTIQYENGSWKERAFSSVRSAISQLTIPSGVYTGEVVAVMGSNGQAKWLVFTNYNELSTGGSAPQGKLKGILANGGTNGWDTSTGDIEYQLINAVSGTDYKIVLEQLIPGTGEWVEIHSWTETATGASSYTQDAVGGWAWGYTFRLRCGTYTSMLAQI